MLTGQAEQELFHDVDGAAVDGYEPGERERLETCRRIRKSFEIFLTNLLTGVGNLK